MFAGYGVGIAAAGGVCIVLMHGRASSAQAWLSLGLVSLAATAVVWRSFVGRDVRSEASRRTGTGRCDTDAMLLVACYGSFGFGYIVPATFLPVMARAAIDDPSVFGWAWPVFGVTAAASTFAAAGLSRSLGNRRLWSLGHVVMAVGLVLPVIRPGIGSIMRRARRRRGCPRAQPPVTACMIVITSPDFTGRSRLGSQRVLSSLWKHST